MKKLIPIAFLVLTGNVSAQVFQNVYEVTLPDTITQARTEPVDLDNDGLPDVLLMATASSGASYLMICKGDTVNGPSLQPAAIAIPPYEAYVIRDLDFDNQLDILLSVDEDGTRKSVVYLNRGDFHFERELSGLPPFTIARFADLDQNGTLECVLSGRDNSGNGYTRTFTKNNAEWELRHDTLGLALSALEMLDLDGNGIPDVFLSGIMNNGEAYAAFLLQEDGKFRIIKEASNNVHAQICDVDLDGRVDVVGFGESTSGSAVYQWYGSGNGFAGTNVSATGNVISAFHADLNSDGIPDHNVVSVSDADTLNVIRFTNGIEEVVGHRGLRQQHFVDIDQDGDLDLMQVRDNDGLRVIFLENHTTTENLGPSKMEAFAFKVYDRVFLFWTGMADDHTPVNSLTYDVFLDGVNVKHDVSFDLANGKRLRSGHGNNGTNNFYLLANKGEPFAYAIQAVDNSLYANPDGLCLGNGINCAEVRNETITACAGETLTLTASADDAMWFSFSDGFLGQSSSLDYVAGKQDTVFYLVPQASCPVVTTVEFSIDNNVRKKEQETIYTCAAATVTLTVDTSWKDISWTSTNTGGLGSLPTVAYQSTALDDIVTVVYGNEEGCLFEKEFAIRISTPEVTVTPDAVWIMKGQSAQLSAAGGEQYSWTPATGLNDASIANPVAAPSQDTRYAVEVLDSIGCSGRAEMMVYVETTGFIPSLFTPNGDGQNDYLKVYGLREANSFSLKIYNREGSVVYKTASVGEAVGSGWDGSSNGVGQPNGVYFWRVEGSLPSGKKLLLNGKEEGSIVLLR